MKIRLLGSNVLVQLPPGESGERLPSRHLLGENPELRKQIFVAIVTAVGPDVPPGTVSVGDSVVVPMGRGYALEGGRCVRVDEILAVLPG